MSSNVEQYIVDNVILENEKLLWRGKSDPELTYKAILGSNGPIKISFWSIFTVIWGLISLEILGEIFEDEDAIIVLLVAFIPCLFTYIGINIIYLSPRRKLIKLQNTYYGITDRRVLIMEFSDKVKIVPTSLSDIENYTRVVHLNDKGSITFKNKKNKKNNFFFDRWTNHDLGMYHISDVSNAAKIIQNFLN